MQAICIVLDDDEAYCDLISAYASENKNIILAGSYTSQEEAAKHIAREKIDLLIVDMEMPGMKGIDFVKSLEIPPLVIFITSHLQYAYDSYEVDAVDYLSKPVDEFRFSKAIKKAITRLEVMSKANVTDLLLENLQTGGDYFVIKSGTQFIKIKYSEILFVEAMADFVKIHTQAQVYVPLSNLKNIESTLPPNMFMRVHRSYLVNLRHVESISGTGIRMGEIEIPLGESYKEAVIEKVVGNKLLKR